MLKGQKGHIKAQHTTISLVAVVTDLPGWVPGRNDLLGFRGKLTYESLTHGHSTRRLSPHHRGHWPKSSMFMCLFLSDVFWGGQSLYTPGNTLQGWGGVKREGGRIKIPYPPPSLKNALWSLAKIREKKSARSFSDRSFSWTSARNVRAKMHIFPGFGGLTEVFGRYPPRNFLFGLIFCS